MKSEKMDITRNIIGGCAEAIEDIHYLLIYCPNCEVQIELGPEDIGVTSKLTCDFCRIEILFDWKNMEYWAYQDKEVK